MTRSGSKGKIKRVENEVGFITNDFKLPHKEIAEAYRLRWNIEVFFRFLKQEFNFPVTADISSAVAEYQGL